MSFLYPRTITIKRPGAQTGVGAVGYGGQLPSTETPILTGLMASIQAARPHGSGGVGLPGDTGRGSGWEIFFTGITVGTVQNRDIVIDDQGKRYQISNAYWSPLGWKCEAQILEA